MNKIIVLDIGATNLRVASVNPNYEIVKIVKERTVKNDVNLFVEIIIKNISMILQDETGINAIVVGVPGYVNSRQVIEELPNLHIKNLDLKGILESHFNMEVIIINDAQAAGYAEANCGMGKEYRRVYYMTISSGVGGAAYENGHEILPLRENGHCLLKYRGQLYDAEHLLSGYGLLNLARLNGQEYLSATDFFDSVVSRNDQALLIYQEWLKLMKEFFLLLYQVYQPDIFIIGGGVMLSSHVFLKDFQEFIDVPMVQATYDQDAGIIGAAWYGLNKISAK